jgi:Raf kinase inhibitor-like YbhB/YbcL family protein
MRLNSLFVAAACLALCGADAAAQNPGSRQPVPGRGGRGGGRRAPIQVMTLTTTAWRDGGAIPPHYAQPGRDVSPPLSWSAAPEGTQSFVLLAHDLDTPIGNGTDDLLHWLVWNIPASATSLPAGVPQGGDRPDGSRQISATGPYYRGPAAPSSGPAHHYVFELFAVDTTLDIPAVGAQPPATRAAVMSAIASHIRGKAALVGTFRRAAP